MTLPTEPTDWTLLVVGLLLIGTALGIFVLAVVTRNDE